MKITRDNYEAWFLDYLEGNLEGKMMDDFIQFIMENPDLKEELQWYEPISLDKENLPYPDKEKLYKESYDIPEIFCENAVAMLEGDLEESAVTGFTVYLRNHPEKNREIELFHKTKLIPDPSVKFKGKKRLYHQSLFILYTRQLLRIAAILILAMILFPLMEIPPPHSEYTGIKTVTLLNPDHEKQDVVRMVENKKRDASVKENTIPEKENQNPAIGSQKKEPVPTPTLTGDLMLTVSTIRKDLPGLLASTDPIRMVLIPQNEPDIRTYVFEIEYYAIAEPTSIPLSDRIAGKIGFTEINLGKIVRWGLDLVSDISKEKFSYTTNPEGEIIAYNLDTRLLGLSIPSKNK